MTDETELPDHIALLWGARETPRRGPKPALKVQDITQAAIAVADAEGLAAVSMAKVAAHLGNSTMALYRYVKSKRELLMLMGDAALDPPPEFPADMGWRESLELWAKAIIVAVAQHPWYHEIPVSAPPFGPHNLMWFDRGLATLGDTDLSEPEKAGVVMGLLTFLRGEYQLRAQLTAGYKEDPSAFGREYHTALTQILDPREFPALTKLVASGVFDEESLWDEEGVDTDFDFSLQLYLDGVAAYLEKRARACPADHDRDSRAEAAPGGTAETPKDNQYSGVPAAPPGTTSIPTLIDRDPRDTPKSGVDGSGKMQP